MAILLLAPASVRAQSAFDGTWKIDTNKAQFSKKPDLGVLQNGIWDCKGCEPPHSVKADGQDHAVVSDDPCCQTMSVRVIDERNFEVTK